MRAIVSEQVRIRHPEHFQVGEDSVVDDFCYLSTRVRIGRCTHIASGCSIAGGVDRQFTMGDFSSLSSGVKVWCTSDDFTRDVVALIPQGVAQVKTNLISGDVTLEDYTAVGSNAVVMPRNRIPVGTVIGALSFVPQAFPFEPWSVYAGIPIRRMGPRDRALVLAQVARLDALLLARRSGGPG